MCTESIIPNTTLYYNFAQNTSQHHFVLQNLHKVLADYIFSELLAQELPVLIRTTKRRVWSVECEVWSGECGVWCGKCGVLSGMWSVKCAVRSVRCEMLSVKSSAKCRVWFLKGAECVGCGARVWSVECGVLSVKCGVWSAQWRVRGVKWSVKCRMWSVKCGVEGAKRETEPEV